MYATGLRCLRCGTGVPLALDAYLCPRCGEGEPDGDPGVLDVEYDYDAAGEALRRHLASGARREDQFRFLPLLPLERPVEAMPVGGTPLAAAPRLAARLGLRALWIKDETRNPTRCLKDRATAVALGLAAALGRRELFCASAGNAAISLAGFCAHQGLACHAWVPAEASPTRLAWLRRYGAEIHQSTGNYDQAFAESESVGHARGWYSRNCAYNPFLVEGKKTAALEIGEQLGWELPDLVVSPVGDGCTLGAIGKGFRELERVGLTTGLPRLVGVQSAAVHPVVERFGGPVAEAEATTRAASIAVRRPRNALRLLAEVRRSGGTVLAVPDAETAAAQDLLAREAGLVAEFTSAATLAGLVRLAAREELRGRSAVLVVTGGRPDEA